VKGESRRSFQGEADFAVWDRTVDIYLADYCSGDTRFISRFRVPLHF